MSQNWGSLSQNLLNNHKFESVIQIYEIPALPGNFFSFVFPVASLSFHTSKTKQTNKKHFPPQFHLHSSQKSDCGIFYSVIQEQQQGNINHVLQ